MLKWLLRNKTTAAIDKDIDDARSALTAMHLLFQKEGPKVTRVYADGVGKTAGLLAKGFRISVPDAIEARELDGQQLKDARRYLTKIMELARPHLRSESEAMRVEARKQAAGGVILSHLYRLRCLTAQAPDEQKARLTQAAETYAQFAHIMSEIGAGTRNPSEAGELAELVRMGWR
jgi:hypothetical protein